MDKEYKYNFLTCKVNIDKPHHLTDNKHGEGEF